MTMTAYCALSDVYPLVPTLGALSDGSSGPPIVAATIPTATQGAALLLSCKAEIDGILGAAGYSLPITDAGALTYLSVVNSYGAAAFILRAKYPTADKPGGGASATTFWTGRYYAALEALKTGALGIVQSRSGRTIAHGFKDANGKALSVSESVTRTDLETRF